MGEKNKVLLSQNGSGHHSPHHRQRTGSFLSSDNDNDDDGSITSHTRSVTKYSAKGVVERSKRFRGSAKKNNSTAIDDDLMTYANDGYSIRGTKIVACLIVIIGCAAGAAFLSIGIISAQDDQIAQFDRAASALALEIESAWQDYQDAGLWVHHACRQRDFTRQDFRSTYEYLRSEGLEFQGTSFNPNVTRDEREAFEAEAREYYSKHYPDLVDYKGFKGLEPDPENPGGLTLTTPRSEQDFYFPVHYIEPVEGNANAVDFDLWSSPSRRATIMEALGNWEPTLTPRLQLVQETDKSAYSVLLYHPGIPLVNEPNVTARDFSSMIIRVPSLLERATRFLTQGIAVYLFDSTETVLSKTKDDSLSQFLGAVDVLVNGGAAANGQDADSRNNEVTFLPETNLTDLKAAHAKSRFYFEQPFDVAARSWTIVVLPLEGTYEPHLVFVIFGGVMICTASVALAAWMIHNMKRASKMQRIVNKAEVENLIVTSLFPDNVRDRLLQDAAIKRTNAMAVNAISDGSEGSVRFKLADDKSVNHQSSQIMSMTTSESIFGSKPIADLFPSVTIMFADLVGFTAWSSQRDPSQVFTLLETVYHSFDTIAERRQVFKVETVGDCYVAVCGLPEPAKNHAVVMARFARECISCMHTVGRHLEAALGPDTSLLKIRIGLHSGQVTAGVLRGLKGRFQLFGDSMNTASRMETTGEPDRIQCSHETALELEAAGKGNWLTKREDVVDAKGKGHMQTYWLDAGFATRSKSGMTKSSSGATVEDGEPLEESPVSEMFSIEMAQNGRSTSAFGNSGTTGAPADEGNDAVTERLIDWNVQVLGGMLKEIEARRQSTGKVRTTFDLIESGIFNQTDDLGDGAMSTVLDNVKEIIALPGYQHIPDPVDPKSVQLDDEVVSQLRAYISTIATMYPANPFHSFAHASQVTMSVTKLLGRIVSSPRGGAMSSGVSLDGSPENCEPAFLHEETFGIASDPLTKFACVFCALIHDVDHPGVPNSVLVQENTLLSQVFKGKSVAEQNSVEIAWQLLMGDGFDKLRRCIFCDQEEYHRFHQLVVNIVMATDVMDKNLGALRRARWEKAFAEDSSVVEASGKVKSRNKERSASWLSTASTASQSQRSVQGCTQEEGVNRKATIVLEHLIQASDVAHTMQHWHIYVKWNERLFHELSLAYYKGRLDKNPADNWYKGEMSFFDFYIIPLAKKLDTCGVFGVSSHELMNYAVRNRQEWESIGQEMVARFIESYREKYPTVFHASGSAELELPESAPLTTSHVVDV